MKLMQRRWRRQWHEANVANGDAHGDDDASDDKDGHDDDDRGDDEEAV